MIRMFGASVDDFEMRVAGVNHLIWLLDLKIKGQRRLRDGPRVRRRRQGHPGALHQRGHRAPFRDHWQVKLALLDIYGYLPAAGDRHVAEFFPYFLTEETGPARTTACC